MLKRLPSVDLADLLARVLREYHDKHDLTLLPISVDELRPIVEGKGIAQQIEIHEVEFTSDVLAATVEVFSDGKTVTAKILLASCLDDYWRRIAVCKELFHCLIDCSDDLRVRTVNDLFDLTDGLASRLSPLNSKLMTPNVSPLDTEIDAELLAPPRS